MQSIKQNGLRIGQLAELAATTPRAIRHYHHLGLLDEPERDESGYRRYGPQHLIRLVRIRRLRSVGMPLERIGASVGTESIDVDIASALCSLADEIQEEIERLADLRTRVLDIAATGSLADPAATWEATLRQHGVLEQSVELPPAEQAAAQLIDALHPQGIQGVVDQTTALISDPAGRQRLGVLLGRFETLPDDASDEAIDALAADYVAALPTPATPPPVIDTETMEKLLGGRLSPVKLRCLRRVRELLERRRGRCA